MSYSIGFAKKDITDRRPRLPMQGMSDPSQKTYTTGLEPNSSPLYSRAFVIEDTDNGKSVAIVIADLWSCTKRLKDEVIKKLREKNLGTYSNANILLAGTHTHSAPGGYAGYTLFDQPSGKVDETNLGIVSEGIASSIKLAHDKRGPGKIYVKTGNVYNCGRNRSLGAFLNNRNIEDITETDKEMLLLKFVQNNPPSDVEGDPEGVLCWYPIHPTDLGQTNEQVSGDNKGYASRRFEQQMASIKFYKSFVAAFANSNCGDVSGKIGVTIKDNNGDPIGTYDIATMKKNGEAQYDVARALFDSADLDSEELKGNLGYGYSTPDMSNVRIDKSNDRTWPYALGLSFAAGSTEDSVPRYLFPVTNELTKVDGVKEGLANRLVKSEYKPPEGYEASQFEKATALAIKFRTVSPMDSRFSPEVLAGHQPKPIIFAPLDDEQIVPHVLPVQLFLLGNVAIAGIPGELTTMAGRRLRTTIKDKFLVHEHEIKHVALSTYANDYAQYITTPEEYEMQHYEGASTPFGPHTLKAYQQEFEQMIERGPVRRTASRLFPYGTGAGVITSFSQGGIYYSRDGKNLGGGGSTIPVYEGSQSVNAMVRYKGGVLTAFNGDGTTGSAKWIYYSRDGKNLGGGEGTDPVYVGSLTVNVMVPFQGGVLTAFKGGGTYYSSDGKNLGGGGGTIPVYEGSQAVTAMVPYRPSGRGGVLTAFSGGGIYYSRDGKNLGGGGDTTRIYPDQMFW